MKSDLAIAALIRSRMTEVGLSRGEFTKRLGYKNIAKGIRRIDVLCGGDVEGTKQFLDALPPPDDGRARGRRKLKSAEVEGPTSVRVFIVMVGLTRMLYA